MKVKDIKKGDIVTYTHGIKNYVNKPEKYHKYFNKNFNNMKSLGAKPDAR